MSSENSIHIKLDYMEAIKSKRSLLSAEVNTLNIAKKIVRYKALRFEEFKLKSRLYRKIKEAKLEMKKLQNHLPSAKIPKILRKGHVEEKISGQEDKLSERGDVESQLREIQRRLEELQSENA